MGKQKLPALLLAGLLLGGCAEPKAEPTTTPPTPIPTPTEVSTPTPTPTPQAEPQESPKSYENIGEETYAYQYENANLKVKYPYLCGPAEDKELNDLLRQEALGSWLTEDEDDFRWYPMGYIDGDWAAPRNDDKLLSVYFEQEYCAGGPVSWDHWGVTIDRANKKRLSLADLVDTGEDFEAWLYAQDWTALNQWQGGGGEIGKDREYIEYQLPLYIARSADPAEHIRDFYLTDTDLVIIAWEMPKYDTRLSVPLADLTLKGENLWNA